MRLGYSVEVTTIMQARVSGERHSPDPCNGATHLGYQPDGEV